MTAGSAIATASSSETELRLIVNVTPALPRQWVPVIGYADVENELRDRNTAQLRPRDVFDAGIAIRRRKLPDPAQVGNAGSFFKNWLSRASNARH